jgi:hypothetical protein
MSSSARKLSRNHSPLSHTERSYICPICGTAPVKDKSFSKHTKCKACKDLQIQNESSKSLDIKEVQLQAPSLIDEERDIFSDYILQYKANDLLLLSEVAEHANLPKCDPLITGGRRYGFLLEYVSKRSLNVSFPISIFLMDTPKETINRPRCLIAIDSPSGSLMDAVKLLVL